MLEIHVPFPETVMGGSEARLFGCSGSVGVGVAVTMSVRDAKTAAKVKDLILAADVRSDRECQDQAPIKMHEAKQS